MNLFATVLTYTAPTANYRGESELNRTVIQKVTDGRFDYPIISPEAMRNALREILAGYGLSCNRSRLHDEEQLAVTFADYPNPDTYIDDFFFGYLIAAGAKDRKKIRDEVKRKDFTFKRDSVLRMNLAKGLEPYRHSTVFTQSPLAAEGSKYKNADTSALLHRETAVTAFQYPFALNLNDCKPKAEWTRSLLKAIGELNDVAGNHARSYFEMAPASIVVRLTESLVAGYALIQSAVHRSLLAVGLEPALGFFHQPRTTAPPLVLDLMELFRTPLWEMPVVGSINRGQWTVADDFDIRPGQVWLSENGRKKALGLFEQRLEESYKHPHTGQSLSYARMIELEARLLEKEWTGCPGHFAQLRIR